MPSGSSREASTRRPRSSAGSRRDLYIPAGKLGYWQGAWRDDDTPDREAVLEALERGDFRIDILYGDYEGGQRVITQFGCLREGDGSWTVATGHHWQIDRSDPR